MLPTAVQYAALYKKTLSVKILLRCRFPNFGSGLALESCNSMQLFAKIARFFPARDQGFLMERIWHAE